MLVKIILWYLRKFIYKECKKHSDCDNCPYWKDRGTRRGCILTHLKIDMILLEDCIEEAKHGRKESDD